MHKYWYNCPIKFYDAENTHYDVLNPQNIQVIGKYNPYVLEVNTIHRVLLPNTNIIGGEYSLFIQNNGIENKLVSRLFVVDDKVIYLSFLSRQELQGVLILKANNNPILYSNCVSFEDTTNNYGAKQLRVITRHNYNRQKFNFDYERTYFAFNLPAYEKGIYGLDSDITNERVGELSTLETTETYLDEFVKYDFDINGNNDIALFLSSITTNSELYINGTKRTLKEAIDYDDYNITASATFVNQKDKFGNNIYIDELDVFSDLGISPVSYSPNIGDVKNEEEYAFADCAIMVTFSDKVNISKDIQVKVFKNGNLLFTRSYNDLLITGNILYINGFNTPNYTLGVGHYYVTISNNSILSDFGIPLNGLNAPETWFFDVVSEARIALISFSDGTRNPKQGYDTTQVVKKDSITNDFDVLSSTWIVNNVDVGGGETKTINLVDGVNSIKLKATYNDSSEILSNELIYNKTPQLPVNLIDVIRVNNSTARFVWDNNGNNFGSQGTATFQMSLDAGNTWQNLEISCAGLQNGQNERNVTSTLLTQIISNTNIRFRILMNGNNFVNYPSNVINKLWAGQFKIFFTDLVYSNGSVEFKLHVEDGDFNGYACMLVEKKENVRRATGNYKITGILDEILNNTPTSPSELFISKYITIPIGVYQGIVYTSSTPNDLTLYNAANSILGFGLAPEMSAIITDVNALLENNIP